MNPKNFEEALYFYYDSQILPKLDHVHDIHSWILDRIVHRNCLFTPDARSLNARDMEDLCRHAVFFLSPFAENREVHPFCRLSCWNKIQPHIALKNPPENGLKFDFLLGDTCKLHMSTRKKILKNLREKTIQKLVTENQKSLQPEVCWLSVLSAILFEFPQVSLHWKTFPFTQQTDDKWTNYSAGVEQSLSSKLFLCKGTGWCGKSVPPLHPPKQLRWTAYWDSTTLWFSDILLLLQGDRKRKGHES